MPKSATAFLHRLNIARRLSPRVVAAKAFALMKRQALGRASGILAAKRDPFGAAVDLLTLDWVTLPAPDLIRAAEPKIRPLAEAACANRFDLLGSGFRTLKGPEISPWLLPPGAQARAAAIRELISEGYLPIPWQTDFRSGHAWDPSLWHALQPYAHLPGVDIKVPWELARAHHLVWFALLHVIEPEGGWDRIARDQMLDLIAANPPGFGVNWVCPMDIAIRGANMALATALFQAAGQPFDPAFRAELSASLFAHADHVAGHFEWHPVARANHFLADVTGLLFLARALGKAAEAEDWWQTARDHVYTEALRQIAPDGGGFESSTGYHRLSAEMLTYGLALMAGRDGTEDLTPALKRLGAAAVFTEAITKPNGWIAQIGDQDDGRFFKIEPAVQDGREQPLDHRHLPAAIDGLLTGKDDALEPALVKGLAESGAAPTTAAELWQPVDPSPHDPADGGIFIPLPPAALAHLKVAAFDDFGLIIWRSDNLFLAFRAGGSDGPGTGAHAHSDQLSIELSVAGEDWIRDPGSFAYTADLDARNTYRSAAAHAVPPANLGEPTALDQGPFRLGGLRAEVRLDPTGGEVLASLEWNGKQVSRRLTWHRASDQIGLAILDQVDGEALCSPRLLVQSAEELSAYHFPDREQPAFSPGFGRRLSAKDGS